MDWSLVCFIAVVSFLAGVFAFPAIAYLWLDVMDKDEDDDL